MYTTNLKIDDVINALATLIDLFVEGAEVIRAQVNRTSMPQGNFVVLTELFSVDLSIPREDFDSLSDSIDLTGPTRIDVQIDFYGENCGDYCKAVQTAFRTPFAYNNFPNNIKPLYTSDGIQAPLINGQQQWQSRWTLTVSLQYNPVVEIPQDSATALDVGLQVLF